MKWNDIGFANLKQSMYKIYDKTNFRIYNPGIEIHPFEQELKIKISDIYNGVSRNMFDGVYYDWHIYNYGSDYPTAYLREGYQFRASTLVVPVEPKETYTIKVHDSDESNQFTIATASTEPKFDKRGIFDMGKPIHLQGSYTHPDREYTLNTPEGDHFLYVMVASDKEPPSMVQVERGSEATHYQPYREDSSVLELKNKTNGSRLKAKGDFIPTDVLMLDGINMTRNGLPFFRHTNKKYIELATGWNEFEITGATKATIEFVFPFYYL